MKEASGKIRARKSSKSMYNPMKARRPNTPEIKVTDLDAIDTDNMAPSSAKGMQQVWNVLLIS